MKIVGHGNRDHIKEQRRTTKTIKAVLVNGSQTETHFFTFNRSVKLVDT